MLRALSLLVLVALVLVATPHVPAQCLGPDGLDVPGACCVPVVPTLPPFPGNSIGGLGICWNNCALGTTRDNKVAWTPLAPTACGQFTTVLTVTDAGTGLIVLTGTVVLDYTRTWSEIDTAGTVTQVWRFTAKADLSAECRNGAVTVEGLSIEPFGEQSRRSVHGKLNGGGAPIDVETTNGAVRIRSLTAQP